MNKTLFKIVKLYPKITKDILNYLTPRVNDINTFVTVNGLLQSGYFLQYLMYHGIYVSVGEKMITSWDKTGEGIHMMTNNGEYNLHLILPFIFDYLETTL